MSRLQAMYAAVNGGKIEALNRTATLVRQEMGSYYQENLFSLAPKDHRAGWKRARKDGWRVRPVMVTVK